MKYKTVLFGYSWIGILNILLLQWFFIRLCITLDQDTKEIIKWDIIGLILPLTGWWSKYIWIYKIK